MIIDFHTHIFKENICKDRSGHLADTNFRHLYGNEKSKLVDHATLFSAMKESSVDYTVAMGFPWKGKKFCEEQNEYFSRVHEMTEGRVLPFGSVPLDEKNDIDGWVKDIREKKLFGISEIGFYEKGTTGDSLEYLARVLAAAEKYRLPVSLHVNEPIGHAYTGKYNPNFSDLYPVLKEYQQVPVILAHWGGGLLIYELMPEIRKVFTNIYYDTAASPYLYDNKIYRVAADMIGDEKILFGSDFPLLKFTRYFKDLESSGLSERARKNILGLNAARILGIGTEGSASR